MPIFRSNGDIHKYVRNQLAHFEATASEGCVPKEWNIFIQFCANLYFPGYPHLVDVTIAKLQSILAAQIKGEGEMLARGLVIGLAGVLRYPPKWLSNRSYVQIAGPVYSAAKHLKMLDDTDRIQPRQRVVLR